MSLSRAEALEHLELPVGADPDSIRTSYKRLAQKWFPEKHAKSADSIERFRQVSLAYKRLNIDNEYATITETEMYETYNRVVQQQKPPAYTNGYHVGSDTSDSCADDSDEDQEDILTQILKTRHNKRPNNMKMQNGFNNNNNIKKPLTAAQIDKNAEELITEEEREKRKAEKRRAKKKRQREKKRLEKTDDIDADTGNRKKTKENGITNNNKDKKINNSSGSEAEEFDRTAAFFTQVKSKKSKSAANPEPLSTNTTSSKPRSVDNGKANGLPDDKVDDLILKSRHLAIEGNKSASLGQYSHAIELFTEAIKLDSRDFRFFGNRSYCFDRMQQYDRALKDAEKAVSLASEWPKGYFRKGRALAGLKLYADAEQAFMQVLKLDKSCEDAMTELIRVRTQQLTEMGFTIQQAEQAIKQYGTVQAALDSLLAGVADTSLANEIYESDDDDYSPINNSPHHITSLHQHHNHLNQQQQLHHTQNISSSSPQSSSGHLPRSPHITAATTTTQNTVKNTVTANTNIIPPMQPIIRIQRSGDKKMDPVNHAGLTALWVGNVLPDISQTKLLQMFQKYGTVTSIRMLPEKYCAFINFKTKEAAGNAMASLQDQDCGGQRLLVKFPDNPVAAASTVLRKANETPPRQAAAAATKSTKNKRKPRY